MTSAGSPLICSAEAISPRQEPAYPRLTTSSPYARPAIAGQARPGEDAVQPSVIESPYAIQRGPAGAALSDPPIARIPCSVGRMPSGTATTTLPAAAHRTQPRDVPTHLRVGGRDRPRRRARPRTSCRRPRRGNPDRRSRSCSRSPPRRRRRRTPAARRPATAPSPRCPAAAGSPSDPPAGTASRRRPATPRRADTGRLQRSLYSSGLQPIHRVRELHADAAVHDDRLAVDVRATGR